MNKSVYILILESSAEICSVALLKDGTVLAEHNHREKNSHSKRLAPMADEILKENGLSSDDLAAVAIGGGPGSYTGLRIGASLAKGICFGLGIPLIAVSSLEAMAKEMAALTPAGSVLCPLIDARRSDAYYGIYDHAMNTGGKEGFCTLNAAFLASLAPNYFFAGSGAEKAKELLGLAEDRFVHIELTASSSADLVQQAFTKQEFVDLAYYEPNYIKSVHIVPPNKPVRNP